MLSENMLERYAEVLIWGLNKARNRACRKGEIVRVLFDFPAVRLAEVVAGDEALSPSKEVFALLLHDSLTETLTSLSPREQLVLRYRFGLEDAETMTLERIGEELGVTRERVRQIEKRALGKLRADAQAREMLLFMEQS